MEVWRGCVCPLKGNDKILRVLDKWGFPVEGETVPVRLKVVKQSQYLHNSMESDKRYIIISIMTINMIVHSYI